MLYVASPTYTGTTTNSHTHTTEKHHLQLKPSLLSITCMELRHHCVCHSICNV